MIRYLIIDDEYVAHDIIKDYCDMLPNMSLQKNCYDAIEALEYLSNHEVDLIFLDLNMPKLKGFAMLRTLAAPPKVIVTTAYQEFALQGYELNVVDYLLKPFSFERFLKAVNKAIGSPTKTTPQSTESTQPSTIFLRSNKKYQQVAIADILFLEATGNYTKVVLQEQVVTVREKISDLLSTLPPDEFFQIHKSFAIAKKHISIIERNRIFIKEHELPIGKIYRGNVAKLLKPPHA